MAAFHALVNRMLSIPLDRPEFERELNTIKHIAQVNGYESQLVDKLVTRREQKLAIAVIEDAENHPGAPPRLWRSIPFIGVISNKIGKILRRNGLSVAFRNETTLRRTICRYKDTVNIAERCGIYALRCGTCQSLYIGQTGRDFKSRFKEHLRGPDSRFYRHILEEDHLTGQHTVAFLHFISKGGIMCSMENMEIHRSVMEDGDKALNERGEGGSLSVIMAALVSAPRHLVRYQILSDVLD